MKTSVGILAQNEEATLPLLLADLWGQSWLRPDRRSGEPLDIVCVINGSTDHTADAARTFFAAHPLPGASLRVVEIERAGKANAWNRYVGYLSAPWAETLFLLDADIRLPGADTLSHLADALIAHPDAVAAVDVPVKTFGESGAGAAQRTLSRAAAELAATGAPKLCGQLYAARAASLRKIPMPEGLLVEDGFLKAMLLTDNFSKPEDVARLVRADDAWHTFEAETAFARLLRHECRILIGTVMNVLVFADLEDVARRGDSVADELLRRAEIDPAWASHLTLARWREVFGHVVREHAGLPLRQWRDGRKTLRLLIGAGVRSAFNLLAAARALSELRKGRLHW
jgi:glycosyltransferase involved in cell wall biosynthesis